MENGIYKANSDSCIMGKFLKTSILKGQSVIVDYSDLDETAFIECKPFCILEIPRDSLFSNFDLIN